MVSGSGLVVIFCFRKVSRKWLNYVTLIHSWAMSQWCRFLTLVVCNSCFLYTFIKWSQCQHRCTRMYTPRPLSIIPKKHVYLADPTDRHSCILWMHLLDLLRVMFHSMANKSHLLACWWIVVTLSNQLKQIHNSQILQNISMLMFMPPSSEKVCFESLDKSKIESVRKSEFTTTLQPLWQDPPECFQSPASKNTHNFSSTNFGVQVWPIPKAKERKA